MKRLFVVSLILLATTVVVHAGMVAVAADKKSSKKTTENSLKEIRLTVTPACEPRPALKYLLLPGPLEREPGNAAPLYLKLMTLLERSEFDQYGDKISEWLELSAAELPRDEVRKMFVAYRVPLRSLELAARRSYCDFELPIKEGLDMQLPSLNRLREIAKVLALKIRLEIADGKIDQALHDLQTGFALARHIDNGITLIEDLVAMALGNLFNQELQNFMQKDDSPNLYWALANLPRPMVGVRKSMEFEASILYFDMPKLRAGNIENATTEECRAILNRLLEFTLFQKDQVKSTYVLFRLFLKAQKYLLSHGYTPEKLQAMPMEKVVLIYMNKTYLVWRDDMFKWFGLPYWQARVGLERAEAKFRQWYTRDRIPHLLLQFLPSLYRVSFLQARLEREFAALQAIEAVRMYAADHKGKLPEKLEDISEAPVPLDPVLGKAFGYTVEGNVFTIDAPVPAGVDQKEARRYIVTLKSK